MDGRATRWEQHKAERRQRLIDAAIALVQEGEEPSLADVAARAGLSRSVVYRQFADRRMLDAAVQEQVLAGLMGELVSAFVLAETVRLTLRRVIGVYVDWASAHPRLHRLADYDTAIDGNGPLQQLVGQMAEVAVELLEATLTPMLDGRTLPPRGITEPFAHGLVGSVFGVVRAWVHREGGLEARPLVELLADSTWAQIDVLLRAAGFEIDPDQPVSEWRS